jgi:hypothetical protein
VATWAELDRRMKDLARAPGVVFDCRGYPTDAGFALLPHLLDAPEDARWMHTPRNVWPDQTQTTWLEEGWNLRPAKPHVDNIAWIIGPGSISYAESVSGYIAAHAIGPIVGRATAGANGNINPFVLPSGARVSWTGLRVVRHDGSTHHVRGVEPTHPVEPTAEGLAAGRDEELEVALGLVRSQSDR